MARSSYVRALARQAPQGAVVLAPRPALLDRWEPEPLPEYAVAKAPAAERPGEPAQARRATGGDAVKPEQPSGQTATAKPDKLTAPAPTPKGHVSPPAAEPAPTRRIEVVEEPASPTHASRAEPAPAMATPQPRTAQQVPSNDRGAEPPSRPAAKAPLAVHSETVRPEQRLASLPEQPQRPPVEQSAEAATRTVAPALTARAPEAAPVPIVAAHTTVIHEEKTGGVHIGSIEVHVAPAPPPPAAPPTRRAASSAAPKAPLARGYSLPFGLGQG